MMVQHLNESPPNNVAGHLDSTANSNSGTPRNFGGVSGSTTNASGKVDGADEFDGNDDFIDLGAETLETGKRIRDLFFLDSNFVKKNILKIRAFDDEAKIEYNLGIVSLIGDKLKDLSELPAEERGLTLSIMARLKLKKEQIGEN